MRWPRLATKLLFLVGVVPCVSVCKERISFIPNGQTLNWHIDEPFVQQSITEYPTVRFEPGDRVTISAGGGVQTGGAGKKTWKLYVSPRGPKSDRLYHGRIEIPGATGHLVRIQSVLGQELTVQPGLDPGQYFLRLGYEDDSYADNGYWGHDDGTDDQCKGVGPAWV